MSSKRADGRQAIARWKATVGRADLDVRRSFVTDGLILVAWALGVIAVVNTIVQAIQEPQRWLLTVPLLGACGSLLLLVLLRHRISQRIRAWGLLLMGYLVAALCMAGLGSLGNGVLLLVVLPALALVLLGPWSGLIGAALSVLIYFGFAGAAAVGISTGGAFTLASSLDLTPWLPLGLAAGCVLVALLLLSQVMRAQVPVLSEARPTVDERPPVRPDPVASTPPELPSLRPEPEAAMEVEASPVVHRQFPATAENDDHYAHLLEAAADISRQVLQVRKGEELLQRTVDLLVDRLGFRHAAVYLVEGEGPQPGPGLSPVQHPELPALRPVPGPVAGQEWASLQAEDSKAAASEVPVPVVRLVERATGSQSTPVRAEVVSGEGAYPQILLPLRAEGTLLAVLHVVGLPDHKATVEATAWREEEVAALEIMADQLAIALENAQLFEEADVRLQELNALQRHYTTEAWGRFVEGRGQTAYRWFSPVSEVMGAEGGDASAETSAGGLAEDVWRSLFERVRAEGRPVSLADEDSGQHVLAMPVRLRDTVIGVLGFRRPRDGGSWQEAEIAAIEGVASRMAFAAENLRLLEEAQGRAAREQALSQMTAHFARSFNMDTVLRAAVRELGRLPDVAEVSVYIGAAQGHALARGDEEVQDP